MTKMRKFGAVRFTEFTALPLRSESISLQCFLGIYLYILSSGLYVPFISPPIYIYTYISLSLSLSLSQSTPHPLPHQRLHPPLPHLRHHPHNHELQHRICQMPIKIRIPPHIHPIPLDFARPHLRVPTAEDPPARSRREERKEREGALMSAAAASGYLRRKRRRRRRRGEGDRVVGEEGLAGEG